MGKRHLPIIKEVRKTVRETIRRYRMIAPGDRILAGISGGPDSSFLARILKELTGEFSFEFGIAHLHHGLRGDAADRDQAFTAALAEELGVPFHHEKADVARIASDQKISVEHAARRVRYRFFDRISRETGYSKIALAHHGDDNAEMVLMALLRGSGPLGLAGIPPVRENRIIRPLFHLSKRLILQCLEETEWTCVIDETNFEPVFLRNKIRMELIPLLETEYNPQIVRSLNRVSEILRAENRIWDGLMERHENLLGYTENTVSILIDPVRRLRRAEKRMLIRHVVEHVKGDLKRISFQHIDGVIHLLDTGSEGNRLDLPDRILVRREKDRIFVSLEDRPLRSIRRINPVHPELEIPAYRYEITPPAIIPVKEINGEIEFSEIEMETAFDVCSAGQEIAFFDIKNLKYPLILRNSRSDDRFSPLGMPGTQRVKNFLKNHGVSGNRRYSYPVVLSGDKIVWVVGQRIDASFSVTDETRKVLRAQIR